MIDKLHSSSYFWKKFLAQKENQKNFTEKNEARLLIDLDKEFKKYNIFPRGFIQVGAHIGQEVKVFKNLNSKCKYISI